MNANFKYKEVRDDEHTIYNTPVQVVVGMKKDCKCGKQMRLQKGYNLLMNSMFYLGHVWLCKSCGTFDKAKSYD